MLFRLGLSWFSLLISFYFFSCSTTNKGLLNREYRSLISKYNVLFNGKESFSIGEAILEEAFEDNFYDLIKVEPINLRGENIDNSTIVPGFDRAEEKAVKTIQKHSIRIDQVQYNRQIDEAYLLLGKARYFDRRFFPALEAFNFLLKSGVNRSNYVEGKIWREKTNIRLKNIELAIGNLRPLARSLMINNKFFSLANASLADAFVNLKQLDSASFYIRRAAIAEPKKSNKARYLFLLGQIYESLGKKDSAIWSYNEIIDLKRKAPRKFLIQSVIKKNLLNDYDPFEKKLASLKKTLKNYENESYEHYLNRALANINLQYGKDSLALDFFKTSLSSKYLDIYTQVQNYKDLANYYFKKGDYLMSGNYYDNLLPILDQSSMEFKKIKRKRDNLEEVISYENSVNKTDSLIYLFSLTEKEQLIYFETYLKQKQKKDSLKINREIERRKSQNLNRSKTSFYFYNPNQISKGKQSYLSRWGNRPNVDNWRNVNLLMNYNLDKDPLNERESKIRIINETPYSYLATLPKTKKEKDSILLVNQTAYLQLGMIYKEKFNDYPLAQKRLEKLLELNPADELKVQALYHLFRINEKKSSIEANKFKTQLIKLYPKTLFAQILIDPENNNFDDMVTSESLYKKALNLFRNQKFNETLTELDRLSVFASGSELEPKISLLKAYTIGRLYGINTLKKELEIVSKTYSAFDEGFKAKELIKKIESFNGLDDKGIIYKNYKWIFPFRHSELEESNAFYEALKKEILMINPDWTVSFDTYNNKYDFVVIHGIRDPNIIQNLKSEGLFANKDISKKENFVTLASKYRDYIKNKTWINTKNERIR